MRVGLIGGIAVTILLPTIARGAIRLEIRSAAAQVTIIPESRPDIQVSILRSSSRLPIRLVRAGDLMIVDGGLSRRVRGCPRLPSGRAGVRVRGLGTLDLADLPRLVIRTPLVARVSVGDGVSGEVGRTSALEFENRGCGGWTIANVRGRLRLDQLGSGAARAGRASSAVLNVAGGGSIVAGAVAGPLTAVSSGEGTIAVAAVDGPVVARVAGSGGIEVAAGRTPQLNASIAGSGSITFGGSAGAIFASIAGPGVVRVAHGVGPVARRIFGAGRVDVGR